MQVGGLAMHWGGVTPRFSPEDFQQRSLFGVGTDWPISYDELDPFYQEAEELMGVAGEQGPPEMDPRGKPFPMPPLPLTYNLELLKKWATKRRHRDVEPAVGEELRARTAGARSAAATTHARRSVPIGAKYSPDFTWNALRKANRLRLVPRTLVRKLVLDSERQSRSRTPSPSIAIVRTIRSSFTRSCSSSPRATRGAAPAAAVGAAGAPNGLANRSGWSASISPDIATCRATSICRCGSIRG